MMLFVYDFESNLLLAERSIIRSRWVVYYNDVGTFEAHLPVTSELSRIVSENPYLVVKQHGISAVVVGYELSDELVIYGRTCNWLLSKRITPEISKSSVFVGEKTAEMVRDAFSDVGNFEVANVVSGGETEFEAEEGTTLLAVCRCLEKSGLGHEITFNEKDNKWEFNILSGKENEIILSEAHKNASNTGISFDLLDYASCGRYEKETTDGTNTVKIVKDAEKTGIYRWEAKLSGNSAEEAQKELEDLNQRYQLSMDADGISWKKDYNLGDVLRLQVIKGSFKKNEKRKVMGVEILVEQGIYKETPILK